MDSILGNVASVRVMRALLAHGGPLPVTRLVRDTRVSPNGVRDALRNLETAGVIDALGSGRSRLYTARIDSALVPAMRDLFASEQRRFERMMDSIRCAAALPQIAGIWLFGSAARGEDSVGSDVDIAVAITALETDIPVIVDSIRDRISSAARILAFSPSFIGLSVLDLRRLRDEQAPLWLDLCRDALLLAGSAPQALVETGA